MTIKRAIVAGVAMAAIFATGGCASYSGPFDKPGYLTAADDDVVYVVREDDEDHVTMLKNDGRLENPITAVGARVDGKKVMAPNEDTLYGYLDW